MTSGDARLLERDATVIDEELVELICTEVLETGAGAVAVSGPDCAGKTTLAESLRERLARGTRPVAVVSMDEFLSPWRPGDDRGFMSYFEQSFDYARLRDVVRSRRRSEPGALLLVEGVFVLRRELRDLWDFSVWLSVDHGVCLARALERDAGFFGSPERVRDVYLSRCLPAQEHHLARDEPASFADVTATFVDGGWRVATRRSHRQGEEAP